MDDKTKFELEFPIHASPQLLYQYISTPSGLSEWFADNVNSRGEMFKFIWDGKFIWELGWEAEHTESQS